MTGKNSNRRIVILLTIMACVLCFTPCRGMEERLQASLITCYPGPEVYELVGHEAIRIRGIDRKGEALDSVWNYGVFDFAAPHFITRFVKGETDYMVWGFPHPMFIYHYIDRGSEVVEQDLSLTPAETARLRELLQINSLPANRTYRYNYVRDNCSTRVLGILEKAVEPRRIVLPDSVSFSSFRDAMRHYHRNYPWYQFGIDIALGGGIDTPITAREEVFAPLLLMEKMEKARFEDGERVVKHTQILNPGRADSVLPPDPWWATPLCVAMAVMLFSIGIAIYEWRRRVIARWWMTIFFSLLGLAGCLVWFLVFVSTHDSTSPNLLALWLNPLQFVLAIFIWPRSTRGVAVAMAIVNVLVMIVLMIIWPLQVQSANPAIFPLWGATLILSAAYLAVATKRERRVEKSGTRAGARRSSKSRKRTQARRPSGPRRGTAAIILVAGCGAAFGADTSRPKLVVGIVIDQLRTDYLEYLKNLYGERGFRLLMDEGAYLRNVDFRADVKDPVSATALIFTGNYPSASGIAASEIYSPSERIPRASLEDKNSMGISTRESLSPAPLLLSTISDEVAIDGDGLTSVYAFSADPQQAIIMAGHAGSAALWINDTDGSWSSSAFYKNYPDFINRRNRLRGLTTRMDTMQWRPMMKIEDYPGIPAQKRYYPFRHTFPSSERDAIKKFKNSALANEEITDVAIEALKNLSLGKRGDAIDMLCLGYTAAPFKFVKDGDFRVELEDTYLRLDRQLARLFNAIDKEAGLENTLIFLTSTGYYDDAVEVDPKFNIPSGDVSLKRVESLLNSYLSAKFGNGDYIAAISGDQLYFDRRRIEEKNIDRQSFTADARDFLLKMSGISGVYTLEDILADRSERGTRKANSINPKTCGDLFIGYSPGWNVIDDIHYPAVKKPVRSAYVNTPFMMYGKGVSRQVLSAPVDATSLAPTLTSTLHIRAPNGAATRPAPIM